MCLAANTLTYPTGGGHLWVYLNWALSLQAVGCRVVWLECTDELRPTDVPRAVDRLRRELVPFGLADAVAVLDAGDPRGPGLERALAADALIDLAYLPGALAQRFRRSALVDLDPGLTQTWASRGELDISGHGLYVTVGEGVAAGTATAPDAGVPWLHVAPCVALDAWPVAASRADRPYTTVTHWWECGTGIELNGEWLDNSKRAAFEPLLDLPATVDARLELALGGLDDEAERGALEARGWTVRDAADVAASPSSFAAYVRYSRGELSAAKPSYVAMRTGWLSDRTACYLASGRPAIVQDTYGEIGRGEPGLLRYKGAAHAARLLREVEGSYEEHCAGARALAEREFDGRRAVHRVLERLL